MAPNDPLPINSQAPDFRLPGIDGDEHSLVDYADKKLLAVVFSCNHCPYVHAYEGRLIALQEDYRDQGLQMVAINSNESVNYPQDSFDNMVVRADQRNYNFPYLRDKSQEVAKAYGARCTPHVFLFDSERKLRYQGGIDDNWESEAGVTQRPLRAAVEALLAGGEPPVNHAPARGCSVKWAR